MPIATAAQVNANRAHAQKSTGPRTPAGKAVVAQNAVQQGLLAQEIVIKGEDPDRFALWREAMLAELAPAGEVKSMLVQRIVGLGWRLRRAQRLQGAGVGLLAEEKKKWVWSQEDQQYVVLQSNQPGRPAPGSEEEARAVDRRIVQDFNELRTFDRLLIHERRLENSLYRTMAELEKRRLLRQSAPAAGTPQAGEAGGGDLLSDDGSAGPRKEEGEQDQTRETNPIVAGVAVGVAEDGGHSCETNPIPGDGPAPSPDTIAKALRALTLPPDTGAQDTGPSCETNPMGDRPAQRQSLCGTEVTSNLAWSGADETKPVSAGTCGMGWEPTAHRQDADATQGHGRDAHAMDSCETKPIPTPDPGTVAEDAAQSSETKPIGAGDEVESRPRREPPRQTNPYSLKGGLKGPMVPHVGIPWSRRVKPCVLPRPRPEWAR